MDVAAVGAVASLSLADVNYNDVGKKDDRSQLSFMGLFTLFLAGGSATFAILAMVITSSGISILAGIIALAFTPVVLVQRFQLSKMTTFREVHNALRQDVTRITNQNDDLTRQTDRLSEKAACLELVESNLQKLVGTQGQSVTSFCALVKENKQIQQKQQDLIVAQVAQQLMTSIVRADRDGDFQISEQEVQQLLFSIKTIKGVESIDEAALKTLLLNGNGKNGGKHCIVGIFDLVKAMYLDNNPGIIAGTKSRDIDLSRSPSMIQLRRL